MYVWVDVRLLYMLVREGLTETVIFDQSPEKKMGEQAIYYVVECCSREKTKYKVLRLHHFGHF